ncbi:MAG: Acg family FMN-binding oxidoreductase [Streptosporangiaceae bacterium]
MPDTLGAASGPALSHEQVRYLVATAGRAPSVHNTQPWWFRTGPAGLELHADRSRQLAAVDPAGRELLISCGAALFGLRLGARQLGHLPEVEVLPDRRQPDLLARVRLGREVPLEHGEWAMLAAVPHRHTHRGAFSPEPLPAGLLPGLQHDAIAEGATLVLLDPAGHARMRRLAAVAARWQQRNASVRAELTRWTREESSRERDGVPAYAYAASLPGHDEPAEPPPGKLAERDFDLGRGTGRLEPGGAPPVASAVLITVADGPADWLHAGQALNRMLIHAAGSWVFAALNSQPMESPPVRALVRDRLRLPGAPQMLLEFGRSHTAPATARRPVEDLLS